MHDGVVVTRPGEPHGPVILLVEDEVLVRLTTAELLREAGYEVLEAVDASEAIAIITTGHPLNLVLTDIRMPGDMDGLELTRTIKQTVAGLPVAIVSSHLASGIRHEADLFIVKPYRPQQLLEAVQKLIGAEWLFNRARPSAS